MKKFPMLGAIALLLSLAACKDKPTFQEVVLGNGSHGFIMACPPNMGRVECVTYAEGYCHGEYNLIASDVGNKSGVMLLSCK